MWQMAYLDHNHDGELAAHWRSLSSYERRLRFGRTMLDADIACYVQGIDYARDSVLAVLHPVLDVIGAAHLRNTDAGAEVGVSVSPLARHQGIETALIRRAIDHARENRLKPLVFRGEGCVSRLRDAQPPHRLALAPAVRAWPARLPDL